MTWPVASVQFQHASGDKDTNLARIDALSQQAAAAGARAVAFHECAVTGYTGLRDLSGAELRALAEPVPAGPSVERLAAIAAKHDVHVLAGLIERADDGRLYNTYVCVGRAGVLARHRKLHPFIHADLAAGDDYTVFDLDGWRCGILTCYDNNIIENVRATVLLGAQVIFMPHVTMGTPSPRPGAGFFDPLLWRARESDPAAVRSEFDGPKGRSWLMKWLPARAADNGVYVVFANPIGVDGEQLRNGGSLILDPFGEVLAECRSLADEVVVARLDPATLRQAGGYRYRQARRPELYRDILGREHASKQKVAWLEKRASAKS